MARRVPDYIKDQILERVDLATLIGERVELRPAGREFKGLCPFHGEKTPSFHVVPDKGFYHCFGCGAHGDAFRFLMEYDKLGFPEALEQLAQRTGVKLEVEETPERTEQIERVRGAHEILARAAEYFRRLFLEDAGAATARAYAERRGLTAEVGEVFEIGWAPSGWTRLRDRLRRSGVDPRLAVDVGLLQMRGDGPLSWDYLRDKFVDRLIFPIHDARGRIVAFGGRALADDQQPKYLNSPTTPYFHKGRLLYNFHRARKTISEKHTAVVVEGYMDLIALHRAGIENAVATLGTALTADHVALLRRQTGQGGRIVLLFDSDQAGRRAAFGSLETVLPEGLVPKAVFLHGGKDPDDVLKSEGSEALRAQVEYAEPLLELFLNEVTGSVPAGSDTFEKRRALERVAPVLAKLPSPLERAQAIQHLAQWLSLDERTVQAELRQLVRSPRPRPAGAPRPRGRPRKEEPPEAERTLLALFWQRPSVRKRLTEESIEELLSSELLRAAFGVARAMADSAAEDETLDPERLRSALLEAEFDTTATDYVASTVEEDLGLEGQPAIDRALNDTLHALARKRLERERGHLRSWLADLARDGDDEQYAQVAQRLLDVERQLRQ